LHRLNPVGLLFGLLVAQQFVLEELQSDDITDFGMLTEAKKALIRTTDLMVIRDPYVVLGLVILAVFFVILLSKMPQVRDEDGIPSLKNTIKKLFRNKKYSYGVIAQILYVGAQIMCWTYIYQYAESFGMSSETAANYQFIAFVLFLIGRAIGTWILKFMAASKMLMYFAVIAVICSLGTILLVGVPGLYFLVAVSLSMSVMFPTIYGIALDRLSEEESKLGAAGLVMAIVGGALMPKLQGMVIDLGGVGVADISILGVSEVNFSFVLPLICFAFIVYYGIWVQKNYQNI